MCRPLSSEFGYFGNTNQGYQQTKQAYMLKEESIRKYFKDHIDISKSIKKYRKDINFFFQDVDNMQATAFRVCLLWKH